MSVDAATRAHLDWIGYVQPTGLVVSAPALVAAQCALPLDLVARQLTLHRIAREGRIVDLPALLQGMLDWQPTDLVAADALTELELALPDYGETLRPSFVVPQADGEPGWQMLVLHLPGEIDLDTNAPEDTPGWRASPQARCERLLRGREQPIGLLVTDRVIRLVYAPRGESSGHIDFRLADMVSVGGRPILGAFCMLLGADRLFQVAPNKRLPAVLKESRKYQNTVSTKLAGQVLGALDDLVRGFELADADRGGELLRHAMAADPQHIYGGLITVLMRLVFLLYAEERDLLPSDPVFVNHYSVGGLFEKLRSDAGRNPDTMDQRFGAWARLVSLFRLVHDGGGDEHLHLPARRGSLFDPELYPFLEGRAFRTITAVSGVQVPRVPDGVVWRVLEKLLLLDGERLSYRALDVEQIGSVYEAMMGFELKRASAPSVAVGKKRVVVSLQGLLHAGGAERIRILSEEAGCELAGKAEQACKAARTVDEIAAALGKKIVDGRIIPESGLYLQPGEERRRSGSHYTPRSLTEPIVRTTLRPVLDAVGPRPTPEQILALKVCDPAMGSGAFLVEACRQLGDALVEAWGMHRSTPSIPADEDPILHARRLVAQRCLYGVDKNPFAVSLAKLSLWLVTLAKDHEFTFLDHALRHGDSLVGLSRRQIARFHWAEEEQTTFLSWIVARAQASRAERAKIREAGDGEQVAQRAAFWEAEGAIEPARAAGDLVIEAFFGADKEKARVERVRGNAALLARAIAGDGAAITQVVSNRAAMRQAERPVVPFHWEIEFPEVWEGEGGGFDAIVGNPPFLGGKRISTVLGERNRDWLAALHPDASSNADLAAQFYRRVFSLLRPNGAFGLVATNTIAQGDTRAGGLASISKHGGVIYDATRRLPWPGQAAVVVSVVHVMKGRLLGPARLDGKRVPKVTAFLFHAGGDSDPVRLAGNVEGSFIGNYVLGMGFTFDDTNPDATSIAEMRRLIARDPRNAERIFPYIGGEEVNDSPTHAHRRYVINFGAMSEGESRAWPELMEIVERKVRPERARANRAAIRERWWQFAEKQPALHRAIAGLDRVLVIAQTSNTLAFAFVPSNCVFAHTLVVFPTSRANSLACLQSRAHQVWALFFAAKMKDDARYIPSDCFETFPFPSDWTSSPALEAVGQRYYEFRAALMVRNDEGLTATYNRFHDPAESDPEILELRRLHAEMDRAVLDAYGWTDIPTECEFRLDYEEPEDDDGDDGGRKRKKKKPWRYRWPEAVHDEVLARLLALNQQRAEEEKRMGGAPTAAAKPAAKTPASSGAQASLFGGGENRGR